MIGYVRRKNWEAKLQANHVISEYAKARKRKPVREVPAALMLGRMGIAPPTAQRG